MVTKNEGRARRDRYIELRRSGKGFWEVVTELDLDLRVAYRYEKWWQAEPDAVPWPSRKKSSRFDLGR